MADPEHVEVVMRGAAAIAEWRQENPGVVLDLSGARLAVADLAGGRPVLRWMAGIVALVMAIGRAMTTDADPVWPTFGAV